MTTEEYIKGLEEGAERMRGADPVETHKHIQRLNEVVIYLLKKLKPEDQDQASTDVAKVVEDDEDVIVVPPGNISGL